ncbi:hypothetical protein [Ornithinimicrobium cavernae]|uniref:hypothetical protein n=1 Tax=Ornithinimicrobium cavernae TaxID=2666047 RepID=UPI000D693056|nr:hypothetical protein [Ornithinimicrobium cavernae]
MSEGQPPDEPFDPYRPPPPGQQPYGQPPPPGQGGPPQGYHHAYPQGPGQYPAYGTPYEPPPRRSSRPLWLGALLGLLLTGGLFWLSLSVPDVAQWIILPAAVAVAVLLIVPATRRWGLGLVIGALLSVPVGLIIFAGVCIVLIASYSQGGT